MPPAFPRVLSCLIAATLSLAAATTKPATSRPGTRPIPSEADLAAARKDLQTKFAKDFEDQTPAGKRRLALLLLREVPLTPGDAALYSILSTARELAVNAGEVDVALKSADDLGEKFNLDPTSIHTTTLFDCGKSTLTPQNAVALTAAAKLLTESLIASDEFDAAVKAATLAEEASRKGGDTTVQTDSALLLAYCKDIVKQAPEFKSALTTLQANPEDPAANTRAGEFIAVTKQEWGRALLMLSRGNEPLLKSAASAELSGSPNDLLTAAEAWTTWAEKHHGPARLTAQHHALGLYFKAAPQLKDADLDKCLTNAGALLAVLGPTAELADLKSARAALGEPRWQWAQSLHLGSLDYRLDAAKNVNSQALLKWKPKTDIAGEVSEPPGESSPKKKRLTYKLLTLVTDDHNTTSILEKTGNVSWRSTDKPLRLNGPANADLKRTNNNKLLPQSAHLTLYLDDIKISERIWKLPSPPKAWWLNESLIQRKDR